MRLMMKRKLNAFYPMYQDDADKMHKLSQDEPLVVTIKRPRNPMHHRKYWALLNLVYENLPHELEGSIKNVDDLHYEMKLQAGYRERYVTMGGQEVWRVKSISFDRMDQDEFEIYYNKCIEIITKFILPGIEEQDILNQLVEF